MSILDNLFDFNNDGKVDAGEEALGLSITLSVSHSASVETFEDSDTEELEERLEELQEELSALEDQLSDLEDNEPEDGTSTYTRWEARQALLENQISAVEEEIEHLEELLEEREDDE